MLARTKDAASQKLSAVISNAWPSHRLQFQIDRHDDGLAFMVFTPQGRQISLTDLSDGEQWFLKFYVRLVIAQKSGQQALWLLDEPGRDLHSSSQIDLKGFFESVCSNSQIIYTSHLPMMVPWHRLERIFAIENSSENGTVIHNRFWKDNKLESPLREALSTFVGEDLISGKEHVIVEGVSDYFFLQGWLLHFQAKPVPVLSTNQYGLLGRVLVPVDGRDKIPLYCWFLGRECKNGANFAVIVDSADDAENTTRKFGNIGLGAWTKKISSVGQLCGKKKQPLEIEGLFTPTEYVTRVRSYYAEAYPNIVVPENQEVSAQIEQEKTENGDEIKITKVIDKLLAAKNPDIKSPDGKPYPLDKTGVSQHIYSELTLGAPHGFSQETERRFLRVMEGIEKMFEAEKAA